MLHNMLLHVYQINKKVEWKFKLQKEYITLFYCFIYSYSLHDGSFYNI